MDRWNIKMPTILSGSISILSDAGLGMAMFSLGNDFLSHQPNIWGTNDKHKPLLIHIIYYINLRLNRIFYVSLTYRAIHGIATKDNSLRTNCRYIFNGSAVLNWSGSYCSNLHCYRPQRCSITRCNCAGDNLSIILTNIFFTKLLLIYMDITGCSSPRNRSLRICQRIQCPCWHT